MKRSIVILMVAALLAILLAACTQAAAPAPTQAPAAPPKAAEPTKVAAPAAPTVAPAPAQPTAAPAPKVNFPEKGKPITLIVPLSAGSGTDIASRVMAAGLEKELGTPVNVVNKVGSSGIIAYTEMIKSKPDGYTLATFVFMSGINSYLDPELKATYSRKDLQPVAHMVLERNVLVVNGNSPYKTIQDLVADAKANPGKVKFGSSGILSNPHVAGIMLEKAAGIKLTIVQFPSVAEALTAMYGGSIDVVATGGSTVLGQWKAGQVRVLGIVDKEENEYFPGCKTLLSMGYDVVAPFSTGVVAPAGTPKEVVQVISEAMGRAFKNPDFVEKTRTAALTRAYMDTPEFTAYWDGLEPKLKPIIQQVRSAQK